MPKRFRKTYLEQILPSVIFLKTLKMKLNHGPSGQTLIIWPWTHHVLILFKLFFNHLYCSMNFSLLPFTIKSWVTCQSTFNVFTDWIYITCSTDVAQTSLQGPIIWSQGTSHNWVMQTFRGRPRLEYLNLCSSWKNIKKYVIQGLLPLKTIFS